MCVIYYVDVGCVINVIRIMLMWNLLFIRWDEVLIVCLIGFGDCFFVVVLVFVLVVGCFFVNCCVIFLSCDCYGWCCGRYCVFGCVCVVMECFVDSSFLLMVLLNVVRLLMCVWVVGWGRLLLLVFGIFIFFWCCDVWFFCILMVNVFLSVVVWLKSLWLIIFCVMFFVCGEGCSF